MAIFFFEIMYLILPIADKTNIKLAKSAVFGLTGEQEKALSEDISHTKATEIDFSQLVLSFENLMKSIDFCS